MSITMSRTQRGSPFFKPHTPNNIGPGAYSQFQKTATESVAPFLSFKERDMFGGNEIPGPGAYPQQNIPRASHDIRTGPFKSQAPRLAPNCPGANVFNYPSSFDNPGPGKYSFHHPSKSKQIKKKFRTLSETRSERRTTPSIPSRKPAKKGFTGRVGDSVGPNHYRLSYASVNRTVHGVGFSKLKENKIQNKILPLGKAVPGPGEYSCGAIEKQNFNIKGNSSFIVKSTTPYPQIHQRKLQPGPGTYDLEVKIKEPNTPSEGTGKIGFLSGTEGRDGWQNDRDAPFTAPFHGRVPGPGYYEKKERTAQMKAKIFSLLDVAVTIPFNSSTNREEPGKLKEGVPGPGAYIDINNPVHSSVTKGMLKFATDRGIMEAQGLSCGPFGTTENRFKTGYFSGNDVPGPGAYTKEPAKKIETEKIFKPQSNSSLLEAKKHQKRIQTSAGTPQYYIPEKWVKQTRSAYFAWANSGVLAFNTTEPRWQSQGRFFHAPGPGAYTSSVPDFRRTQTRRQTPSVGTHSRSDSYRPRTGTSQKLGPGSYIVGPSMIKKSFNISFDTSVAQSQYSFIGIFQTKSANMLNY